MNDKVLFQQHILKKIKAYLEPLQSKYSEHLFEFEVLDGFCDNDVYEINVSGYYKSEYKSDELTEFTMLKLFLCHSTKQIHISNIFLPSFMKYNGIGKKLISEIFMIVDNNKYKLFLVDMVSSFYNKMICRYALPCDGCDDAVQIVSQTRLC